MKCQRRGVNIKLDLHTGGAQKKVELPLKVMVMGDYSNGKEQRPLSERGKVGDPAPATYRPVVAGRGADRCLACGVRLAHVVVRSRH